jgi:hypothetical protein
MEEQNKLVVDQHYIRFAMLANLILLSLAWILNSWIPLLLATLSQLLGATKFTYSPYAAMYNFVIVPFGVLNPYSITDDPVPHRFASLIGGIHTFLGISFLLLDYPVIGWFFIMMVFTFQNLNLWVNFCMMYSMYYLLYKIGIPGFTHAPLKNK